MTFLPIVGRELREGSRRRGTYWLRAFVAFQAILIGIAAYFINYFDPGTKLGTVLFWGLSGVSMLFCLLAGRRSTADCISQEKRDGTLGLLFLTDLKGYDVVLGKLAATSVTSLYSLLAVFPVLAVPLLTGGMTNGEVGRMAVVLTNTFFLSIAIGIFASAISRDYRAAMGANFFLWLVLVGAPAGCGVGWDLTHSKFTPELFYSCPILSFALCADINYAGMASDFWWSIGVTDAVAWALVFLACWIVPRTWGDKPPQVRKRNWHWKDLVSWLSYGNPEGRGAFRKWALDMNAYFWLAARARLKLIHGWLFVAFSAAWWLFCWAKNGPVWLDDVTYFSTAIVLNSALKLWITLEAGLRLGEDRRGGAFELLLATPLTVPDILGGQILALRRQFLRPLAAVFFAEIIFLALVWHKPDERRMFVAMLLVLPADVVALVCVAMRAALTSKGPARVNVAAVSRVLVLPWALFGAVQAFDSLYAWLSFRNWQPNQMVQVAEWVFISLAVDLVFAVQAWQSLQRDFRTLAILPATSSFSLKSAAAMTARTASRIVPARLRIPLAVGASIIAVFAIIHFAGPEPVDPPVTVTISQSNGPVRIFSSGPRGVYFILPDGTLWRWGITETLLPCAAMPVRVGTNHDWVKVTGNGRYWLGLNSEGTILESGMRGSLPRYKWADVGVGSGSDIGLAKNGMVWTWSAGNPGLVGTGTNWVAVANPNTTYLALRNDGTLWAWGRITDMRSGNPIWVTTNINEPVLMSKASNWVNLNANGELRNRAGELWDAAMSLPNSNITDASNCRLISTNWRNDHIETGSTGMAAHVQRDGILWSAMPDGSQTLRPISSRSDWVSVWAFNATAFGMTGDGTIWMWGLDLGRIPTTRLQTLKLRIMNSGLRPRNDMLLVRQEPRPLFKLTYQPSP
jgi:hypothetical protein